MQGCRRSWEDKLKCVKILSVKDHNSAKICRTWIISPHALLDLWCNICTKFHSNPCKDVGGVEKTNFDATEGRNDGRTDKANTKCPFAILGRGHKNVKIIPTQKFSCLQYPTRFLFWWIILLHFTYFIIVLGAHFADLTIHYLWKFNTIFSFSYREGKKIINYPPPCDGLYSCLE